MDLQCFIQMCFYILFRKGCGNGVLENPLLKLGDAKIGTEASQETTTLGLLLVMRKLLKLASVTVSHKSLFCQKNQWKIVYD